MSAPAKKAAAKKAASRPASQQADAAPEEAVVTTVGDALAPIAEAAAYVTAPAESGDAVATGYFLPQPPDVRGHSKKRR